MMEASTFFRWTFRIATASRAGNSYAYREFKMRGRVVTKGISLIITYDTDIETSMVDHRTAFQSALAATISICDLGKVMSVGRWVARMDSLNGTGSKVSVVSDV
jgi:hypothetical protein